MGKQEYSTELQRALARPDAEKMCRQVDAYADYFARGAGDWPDDEADDFEEIVCCHHDDPEKALAYIVIAASRSDDAAFLGYVGCGPLEDILRDPSEELLGRVVAEARKSARFRWLLSHPFNVAIAERSWEAIRALRTTGPGEEPSPDTLPPRQVN
jgi:hypothetical protein